MIRVTGKGHLMAKGEPAQWQTSFDSLRRLPFATASQLFSGRFDIIAPPGLFLHSEQDVLTQALGSWSEAQDSCIWNTPPVSPAFRVTSSSRTPN
jgi:hypothetical protein